MHIGRDDAKLERMQNQREGADKIGVFFVRLAMAAAVMLPLYALARAAYLLKKKKRPYWGREICLAVFVLFMCGLMALVWNSAASYAPAQMLAAARQRLQTGEEINLVPFHNMRRYFFGNVSATTFLTNIVGNVAMFVPFGFCLPLFWRRWRPFWRMCIAGVLFPVFIETTQLFIWRTVDVDDLILNFAGILLGYGLYRLVRVLAPGVDAFALPQVAEQKRGA